jgi:t-SNARE complex subunit (syntaxin)
MINRIEDQVENAAEFVEVAAEEMKAAVTSQRSIQRVIFIFYFL